MIADVLLMIAGGAIGIGGAVVANALARRRRPDPLAAMCSCGHGAGMHARAGSDLAREFGVCRAVVPFRRTWNDPNSQPRYETTTEQCACEHYDGPDPDQLRLLRGA